MICRVVIGPNPKSTIVLELVWLMALHGLAFTPVGVVTALLTIATPVLVATATPEPSGNACTNDGPVSEGAGACSVLSQVRNTFASPAAVETKAKGPEVRKSTPSPGEEGVIVLVGKFGEKTYRLFPATMYAS